VNRISANVAVKSAQRIAACSEIITLSEPGERTELSQSLKNGGAYGFDWIWPVEDKQFHRRFSYWHSGANTNNKQNKKESLWWTLAQVAYLCTRHEFLLIPYRELGASGVALPFARSGSCLPEIDMLPWSYVAWNRPWMPQMGRGSAHL